jgi:predicted nucleotidyltransferase
MKIHTAALLSLICMPTTVCWSQDALVIQLTKAETQEARSIYLEQKALDQRMETLRLQIARDYLEAPASQDHGCVVNRRLIRPEWGCAEFRFSSDFRFIVPGDLTSPPFNGTLFEVIDGKAVPIKEKPPDVDLYSTY